MFEVLLWLFVKHFICDFPLQASAWIYRNKGTYGHLGGLTHAAIHGVGSLAVLFFWLGTNAWLYAAADMLIHYHIDWAKMNVSKKLNLNADNSQWFWILLGFDQLLHHLTYFLLVAIAFR